MLVLCTRPRPFGELPHWNDVSDALFKEQDFATLQTCKCSVCDMSLILEHGRYAPIAALSQGGFGYTFLAFDVKFPRFDRAVAQRHRQIPQRITFAKRVIKQFRRDQLLLPGQIDSAFRGFEQEVQVLDQLQHPQIPQVYEPFQVSAQSDCRPGNSATQTMPTTYAYFVQQPVAGRDLQAELAQRHQATRKLWTEAEVRHLLVQLLDILHYIHTHPTQPIVHCDITPSNIIDGEDGRFYLVDFGAVKPVGGPIESGLSHPETQCVVSAGYSPPEQHYGQVDCSSDLYALAKTCLYLFTGSPYTQTDWQKGTPISPTLVQILQRMTEFDPQKRYRSAAAVQVALMQHQWPIVPLTGAMLRTASRAIGAWLPLNPTIAFTTAFLTWVLPSYMDTRSEPIPPAPPAQISDITFPNGDFDTCCSTSWEPLSDAINSSIQQPNTKTRFLRQQLPANETPSSELGLDQLIQRKLDFALISKNIPDTDIKQAKAQNLTLKKIPIGKIALAVIVHPDLQLPLGGLTDLQVTQIQNCAVKNWQELDGPDLPIQYYTTKNHLIASCSTHREIRHAKEAHQAVAQDPGGFAISPSRIAAENCDIQVLKFGKNSDRLIHPFEAEGVSRESCRSGQKSKVNLNAIKDPIYRTKVLELSLVLINGDHHQEAGEAYAQAFKTDEGRRIMRDEGVVPCGEISCSPFELIKP
jgi:serine/threonine protein kinase